MMKNNNDILKYNLAHNSTILQQLHKVHLREVQKIMQIFTNILMYIKDVLK